MGPIDEGTVRVVEGTPDPRPSRELQREVLEQPSEPVRRLTPSDVRSMILGNASGHLVGIRHEAESCQDWLSLLTKDDAILLDDVFVILDNLERRIEQRLT